LRSSNDNNNNNNNNNDELIKNLWIVPLSNKKLGFMVYAVNRLNLNPCGSDVELNSRASSAVPDRMSASNRRDIYPVLFLFTLSSTYLATTVELQILQIFSKINLGQTVGIHKNNFDRRKLKVLQLLAHSATVHPTHHSKVRIVADGKSL
jgi:hypothetical protein